MTKQRALLLLLVEYYNTSLYREKVTYEEVNHLAFIAQCLGTNLKLEFEEDQKGPFNQKINKLLLLMASNEYLSIHRGDSGDNIILVNNKRFKQKNNILKNKDTAEIYENTLMMLQGFETKERLKVLTVTLWFYKEKRCEPDILYAEVVFESWIYYFGCNSQR